MHNISDLFEFWPDWPTDNRVTSPSVSKNTPIIGNNGKMVSTVTYLRTIQHILMTCWLSGERSLPLGPLVALKH